MTHALPPLSQGTLLDGRVRYAQPVEGYRTGLEPVLLAAFVPARAGERVVEAGTGAGAGLLALAARIPGIIGYGLERDPAMAAIARHNLNGNGGLGCTIETTDIDAWHPCATFDHAFANPPWHDAAGTVSPQQGRAAAKVATPSLLNQWAMALGKVLRPRGTLSLICPAASLSAAIVAVAGAGCPEITLCPLHPRAGAAAKLMLLRGARLGKGPCRILPGLILHTEDGGFTQAATEILRNAKAIENIAIENSAIESIAIESGAIGSPA